MIFEQLNTGPHKTYLVADPEGVECMLVDPVLSWVDDYLRRVEELGLHLRTAVDTHTHADHITGCPELARRTECAYVMHEMAPAGCVDERVTNGDILTLGEMPIDVLHTPGHAADAVTLIVEGRLVCGDVLFIGSAGRSDLPGGDPDEHWHTLHRTFQTFPDNTLVFPAHDYGGRDFTSLGHERRTNPHYDHKDRYSYVRWQEDLRAPVPAWVNRVIEANFQCDELEESEWRESELQTCQAWGGAAYLTEVERLPKELGVIKLHERIERGKNPILMLDIREEDEFRGPLGHVEGAYHVPMDQIEDRMAELEPFRQSEVITICRSGGRSMAAAALLQDQGFEDVKNLRGGMIAWNSRGYRVDR